MPPARSNLRFRRALKRSLLAIALAGLLAGCSFSEGDDWPPLTPQEAAGEAPLSADRATDGEGETAADAKWKSLAKLVGGEPAAAPPGGGAVLVGRVRPLVVIRFAGAPVDYETTLYETLKTALKRRPQTAFDLVAVAPSLAPVDQAALAASARAVVRSLGEMGFPAERLSLSATSYPGVTGSEVHLYVR